jgi:hypothetical protein
MAQVRKGHSARRSVAFDYLLLDYGFTALFGCLRLLVGLLSESITFTGYQSRIAQYLG